MWHHVSIPEVALSDSMPVIGVDVTLAIDDTESM